MLAPGRRAPHAPSRTTDARWRAAATPAPDEGAAHTRLDSVDNADSATSTPDTAIRDAAPAAPPCWFAMFLRPPWTRAQPSETADKGV